MEVISLEKKCEKCGADEWIVADKVNEYYETCTKCAHMNEIIKQDFVDEFQCPECNCLEGTLEENKKLLAVRCKNCSKQIIVLEKQTTLDHRSSLLEKQKQEALGLNQNIPKCPKCNSASISTGQRGYTLLTGFLGSNKTMNRCANCGHKWNPSR